MKSRLTPLFLLAALALSATSASAQSDGQEERIGASFVLALGRAPSAGETGQWSKQGKLSIAELVALLQQQSDAGVKRATAAKACADAFGREPAGDEINGGSYTGLMQRHIQWLAGHPKEYEQVIERAYQLVMQRRAFTVEIDYWQAQPVLSFALLAGCIENWARRNAPGLMATTGTATVSVNSAYLTTVRLPAAIAAEARAAVGLFAAGDANLAAATGRNIIAAGAGQVVSSGGINFVAAGSASLAPVRRGGGT